MPDSSLILAAGHNWRRARTLLRKAFRPATPASGIQFSLNAGWVDGFLDSVEVDPAGIIRLLGWRKGRFESAQAPAVFLDEQPVPFLQSFRLVRPDVPPDPASPHAQTGIALDYLVSDALIGHHKTLSIELGGARRFDFKLDLTFLTAHYWPLYITDTVLHRAQIYGSGPPNKSVHPDVFALARQLEGPLLDFGCGRGSLVGELRKSGVEAFGLEMDSDVIRTSIAAENAAFITLYDGGFPSPFQDGQFRSVLCSEVLEHIPDYQAAVRDIARLATEKVIFTVPDASAIPTGFRHGAVPWHLLEGTHLNFFNQRSLQHALQPYFSQIEFGRVGLTHINDSPYYVSLVAICSK